MQKLTINELIIFEILLIQNRDNAKLQKLTNCDYLQSKNLLNKIREILEK